MRALCLTLVLAALRLPKSNVFNTWLASAVQAQHSTTTGPATTPNPGLSLKSVRTNTRLGFFGGEPCARGTWLD